jgi:integrase
MARKTFRKKITTPENLKNINPQNKKLMDRFLKEKNTRCSDGTIVGYKSDLEIFFTWNLLYNDNKPFLEMKKIEFSDFFNFGVQELKWGSSRFDHLKSCLSGLSDFIEKFYGDDYKEFRNVILKVIESLPKNPVRKKTILTETQINDLLKHIENDIGKPQEACLLALAIGCGARISELFRFKLSIIDEKNLAFDDIFIKTTEQIKTKGFGKQGSMLNKFIIKDIFLPFYHKWLPERKRIMEENNEEHDFLFIRGDGKPAQASTSRTWIKKWEHFLEVDFYPHCLRHYIVTYLTRLGMPSDLIIYVMGWKTADMYKIYNDLTAEDTEWKGLDKVKDKLGNFNN